MSVETNDGILPASLDKKIIIPGMVLYKNILTLGNEIIEKLEGVLSEGSNYKWSPAMVGNRQRVPDYRDCLDFKFKKSTITGTDKNSEIVKDAWQYLFDKYEYSTSRLLFYVPNGTTDILGIHKPCKILSRKSFPNTCR